MQQVRQNDNDQDILNAVRNIENDWPTTTLRMIMKTNIASDATSEDHDDQRGRAAAASIILALAKAKAKPQLVNHDAPLPQEPDDDSPPPPPPPSQRAINMSVYHMHRSKLRTIQDKIHDIQRAAYHLERICHLHMNATKGAKMVRVDPSLLQDIPLISR